MFFHYQQLVQNLHKLRITEKPINIIQDKNYQSDFDRLMAETAETKYPNWSHLPTTQSLWLRGFLYVSTFSAVLGGKNIFHYDNKKLKKRHFIFDFTNGNPSLQKRGVFFCFIQFQELSPPSPNIPRSIPVPPRQYLSRSSPHRPAPTVPRHSHASTPEEHPSAASPLIDFCMRPDRIIR